VWIPSGLDCRKKSENIRPHGTPLSEGSESKKEQLMGDELFYLLRSNDDLAIWQSRAIWIRSRNRPG
jgi:hypothetical protein